MHVRLAFCIALATVAVGCSSPPTGTVAVPPDQMSVDIANYTTISVAVAVNGSAIHTIPPATLDTIKAADLPALPWSVEARTSGGRVLVSLTIHEGDVQRDYGPGCNGSICQGDGARVDLSCGRIDITSGPPLVGPANGPGTPGDCEP